MYEENIHARTEKFHQDVIESTIDSLSWHFNENGLSEDLLDRLKASWEKNLKESQDRNVKEAMRRRAETAHVQ